MDLTDIAKVKDTFNDFASKPASIIYVSIATLLLISVWRNPTDLLGVVLKIIILTTFFVFITVFNSLYFKHYWK